MSRRDTADQGQPSTRRPGTLTDQHGRKWRASIDKKSGFPVGVIQPLGWLAPWMPPQGFFRFTEEEPTRMEIDYEAILNQRLQDHEQWAAGFRQAALVRGWDPDDKAKAMNITEIVGKKPQPVEPVVAAMQGNRWILGLTQKVDPRLEPFTRQAERRVSRVLQEMDFSDDDDTADQTDEEFEDRMDLQEAVDPEATPRGRVPIKPKGGRKNKAEVAA